MKSDTRPTSSSLESLKAEHWKLLPHSRHCGEEKAAEAYKKAVESSRNSHFYASESSDDGYAWQIVVWPLDWDSRFFGFKTARLDIIAPPVEIFNRANVELGRNFIKSTLEELRKGGFELLTVQVDVADTAAIQSLEKNAFLLVDTIVGYEFNLHNWKKGKNPRIRPATASDEEQLKAISAECFGDRSLNINRFNSELKLTQKHVTEMYELWIVNSLSGKLADQVLLYEEDGEPLGFITIRLPSYAENSLKINCATIPLNAVTKKHQGKGIYKQLVAASLSWLKDKKIDHVQIKTQLPNVAVHSAWQNIGARLFTSYHTFQKDLARD